MNDITHQMYATIQTPTKEAMEKCLREVYHFVVTDENHAIETTFGNWEGCWEEHDGQFYAMLFKRVQV